MTATVVKTEICVRCGGSGAETHGTGIATMQKRCPSCNGRGVTYWQKVDGPRGAA